VIDSKHIADDNLIATTHLSQRKEDKMKRFDIFSKIDVAKLGEMCDEGIPTICFDGGDVYEGWSHETFRLTESGLTFERWESGGYQDSENEEERPSNKEELKSFVLNGQLPLPRWSNQSGLEFLNKIMNKIPEDEIKHRIAQIRDALNKCRDIERVEAAARVFGV
jgi:hypothetical protein